MSAVKKITIVATAVAVIGVVAVGGVFAYKLAGNDASDLAALVPSDAVAFVSVTLDPKADQKLKFNNLLNRAEKNGGESLGFKSSDVSIDVLLDKASETCNMTEREWVGDSFGVAVVPAKTSSETPSVVGVVPDNTGSEMPSFVYISSKDDASAKKFVKEVLGSNTPNCSILSATVVDDWVVLGSVIGSTDALPTDGSKSLANNKSFSSDTASLKDQGLLTYWVDVNAPSLLKSAGTSSEQLKGIDSAFGTVRATDNSIESFNHISVVTPFKTVGTIGNVLKAIPSESTGVIAFAGIKDVNVLTTSFAQVLRDISGALDPSVDNTQAKSVAKLFASPGALAVSGTPEAPKGAFYTEATVQVAKAATAQASLFMFDKPSDDLFVNRTIGNIIELTLPSIATAPTGTGSVVDTQGFKDAVGDYSKSVALAYISADLFDETGISGVFTGASLNAAQVNGGVDVTFRVGIK